MTVDRLKSELAKNREIIRMMLSDIPRDFINFKKDDKSWSPLIAICHLVDEEKEDFRFRIQHLIKNPESAPAPIDPEGWVVQRLYEQQDFQTKVNEWIEERNKSIEFLNSISENDLSAGFDHTHFGRFTVGYLMDNWLAHDLLHIRQLTRMRYHYLKQMSDHSIEYAGRW